MDFDFRAGKTPLQARQNSMIYVIILISLVIIAFLFLVWFLLRIYKKHKETPEFLEKEKNRITNKNDVELLSKKQNLSKTFAALLLKICKMYEIPNILYSIKDIKNICDYFDKYYREQKNNISPQEINNLFNLKYKLERIYASYSPLTNTYSLPANMQISQIFKDGSKKNYTLYTNKKEYLAIEVPEAQKDDKEREALSKIAFTFTSETGMSYAFLTRIMRYEKTADNRLLMIVSHSNNLITKQQRNHKRIYINEKTTFSSLKKQVEKKQVTFVPSDQKYNCVMTNISAGGCCITSTLPIKEGQMVSIELPFNEEKLNCYGKIIRTRKSLSPGIYNLHIQFLNLPLEVQNSILIRVNNINV